MSTPTDDARNQRRLRNLGVERAARNERVGLWRTLGYRLESWDVGTSTVSWDATPDYGFATADGYRVQGGLVTAVLDAAMGGACWTVLDETQIFLTVDLRMEFLRATPVGPLTAVGTVVRATSRAVFCAGELRRGEDPDGSVLAAARCTQVVLPAEHGGRRDAAPTG